MDKGLRNNKSRWHHNSGKGGTHLGRESRNSLISYTSLSRLPIIAGRHSIRPLKCPDWCEMQISGAADMINQAGN